MRPALLDAVRGAAMLAFVLLGAPAAACTRASGVMRAQSPAATASAGVSHEPPHTFTLGSARNCGALSGGDAAGGAEHHVGERPGQALSIGTPPAAVGREELQERRPSAPAAITSLAWPRRAAAAGRRPAGGAHGRRV
jgi:hypothetical protein